MHGINTILRLNSLPSGRHFQQIRDPSNVPDRILRAIDRPSIDGRGPAFRALAKKVLPDVRAIFKTRNPIVIYPVSSTGVCKAALVNTLSPGDAVLNVRRQYFKVAPYAKVFSL